MSRFIKEDKNALPSRYIGNIRNPNTDIETDYNLVLPIKMYSFFENALRRHWGKTIKAMCANMKVNQASEETIGISGLVQYNNSTSTNWFHFK